MKRLIFPLVFMIGLCLPLMATGFEIESVSTEIQKTYDAMTSMQARFEQTSSVQGMRHRQEYGKGTLIIQKPAQLRWDYVEPDYKVLVSDGIDIFFYVRNDNQMFVSPASDYLQEDLTYRFFTGQAKIMDDFTVEKADESKHMDGTYCLKLTPKKTSGQVAHLFLWVDIDLFQLQRLQLVDYLNTVTDFKFYDIVMNKKYDESIFVFSPPKGTEIILPNGSTVTQ